MKETRQLAHGLYTMMQTIRQFEERVVDLYARGLIPGLAHLYVGEEAVAAGVCAALNEDDYITSTHRGHGHVLAKGARLAPMMAELYGKATGYCKGKGGSMHIADMHLGILGANGIAGGGLPIATGAAWAAKWKKTRQVAVAFFGDDSSNNGTFHESLNIAGIHRLPVVYVCEHNGYGISVSSKKHLSVERIALRAAGYNMPGVTVDGNDVLAVHQAAAEAVARARKGEGPTLLECVTYRTRGHHEGDPNQGERYRERAEIAQWKLPEKDPIARMRAHMLGKGLATEAELDAVDADVARAIDEAVAFAGESPLPEPGELYTDVFVAG